MIEASVLVLEAEALTKHYPVSTGFLKAKATVQALQAVSFSLAAGRTLAVVGESGCGKSTLARQVTMLETPTAGRLRLAGHDVAGADAAARKALRRTVQMVFQNPFASLNPRKKIGQALEEPLAINTALGAAERAERSRAMLARVGLRPEHHARYPHMFSGGQRQRIGIARALGLRPKLIIADEPVSALDVSIQAQIINLLEDLQEEYRLTFIFVAHDLSVVRHVADRIAVMYLGKIVEIGPAEAVYNTPIHPYTHALLSAVPIPDPRANANRKQVILEGDVPSPANPPSACRFHTRCPRATEICSQEEPPLIDHGNAHFAACHHPLDRD